MGESLTIEKFDVQLNWPDPEQFLEHYNHLDLSKRFYLIWSNNKLQFDDNHEIYASQLDDFVRLLVKNSSKGVIHVFISGYNEYFGYEWEHGKVWNLRTRIEYYRDKEITQW